MGGATPHAWDVAPPFFCSALSFLAAATGLLQLQQVLLYL